MTPAQLDALFPWVCFFYGAVMTLVLNSRALNRIADERMPIEIVRRWRSHGPLAYLCLFVGAIWILQNLWLA